MEILLTGNTSFITHEWIENVFPEDHVLTTNALGQLTMDSRLKSVTLDNSRLISQLVQMYEFDRIVYFSDYLIPHNESEGELDRLRRVLQANRERDVQLLYISGPESVLEPPTGKTLIAQAAERLCLHYASNSKLQVKVLRTPYLYGTTPGGAVGLAPLFEQMEQGKVVLDEPAQQIVTALCVDDLADLVSHIFDVWTAEAETFLVPEVFHSTHLALGQALQKLKPGLEVQYGTDQVQTYPPDDHVVRQRYGWFPRYDLLEDLPEIYAQWRAQQHPKEKPLARLWNRLHQRKRLLIALELLVMWVVAELLVVLTNTQSQFRMVDFRLLFVVLSGTLYGLNAGVCGAVLASVSLAIGYFQEGMTPLLLFYEPSNWLAFICYFVAGAVCGYVQLRSSEAVRFVQQESEQLRARLRFMRQVYQDTLEDKQQFRRQLLGRRDSFGKIYTVTQQLNVLQPQEIYRQTVQIMENILDNHSLTIYQLDAGQRFARLTAASAAYEKRAPRSVEIQNYAPVLKGLEQADIWVNREFVPGYAMYTAGIKENGRLAVLISLNHVREDQMTLYYENLFRILCGLVETALVRAFEYESVARETRYLPGTCLLRTEFFNQRLAAACALEEDKMAQHLLLRMHGTFATEQQMSEQLEHVGRANDVAGIAADGSICMLMEQAADADFPVIKKRMNGRGLKPELVPLDEQLRLLGPARPEQEPEHD